MSYNVASTTLPISCSCSSAGTEPSSTLPKNDGATTMYHAFPRHLSRTCLVLADKLILQAFAKILRGVLKCLPFCAYFVDAAHVFPQNLRNGYCAVFLLI